MLPASLHNRGQLIYLQIKTWQARKLDKKATKKIVDESSAAGNAARVNKYLMADSTADAQLRAISQIARKTRAVVEAKTVPWNDAGMRLVSNIATFELLGDIRECEQEFNDAVEAFLLDYPSLRELSLVALGDMANEDDYPPVDVIRQKFAMRTTLEPIAPGFTDDRTGLTDDERKMLDDHYAAVHAERMKDANDAMFVRLVENLERYVDRLTLTDDGKNKTFTHTMVDNLRETMAVLDSLGLFDTTELAKLKHEIEVKVCQHDVKDLRDSLQASTQARQAASSVLSALRGSTPATEASPLPPAPTTGLLAAPASASRTDSSVPVIVPIIQPAPSP
jgi:hypothetical protein